MKFTLNNALQKADIKDETKLIIRSDNGPQMSSNMFREHIKELAAKIDHEFIPPTTQ